MTTMLILSLLLAAAYVAAVSIHRWRSTVPANSVGGFSASRINAALPGP